MKFLFGSFFFLTFYFAQAQQAVSGTVMDSETNQLLPHCSILLLNSKRGNLTGEDGKFKIEASVGDRIVFSYVGYQTDTLVVEPKLEYEIFLMPIHSQLDEVVVTALTRTGLIRENPISINNVTLKMMERSNESNVMDVLAKNTPGLSMLKTGPNISKPFIRGMGFNRVLTLYDGVRQEGQQWGGEHGLEIDNYNIERAEIIKGPASLAYGSDALAGVISLLPFIPKETDGKVYGRWLTEYQSNNGLVGNGFRLSQGNKHWLWAMRGSYRLAKNYSNRVDGRVYNSGFQEKSISALLGYKGTKGFTHFNISLYDNQQGIPDGSRDSLTRKFTRQIFEAGFDDATKRPVVSDVDLNSYAMSPLHQRIQYYRAYLKNHYEVGGGDIQTLLAFSQNLRREFIHPTMPERPGTYLQLNTFTYSLRYNAPVFFGIETSFGVNGMYQKNTEPSSATNFAIPAYDLNDLGLFVLGKWKKDAWTVTGGARMDTRNIRTHAMYVGKDSNGFDIQVSPPDTIGSTLQFKQTRQNFSGITASLGTAYQMDEHFSFKLNISRGFRAPSISEIAANGLDGHIVYIGNSNFTSEFSWQEDAGLFAHFSSVSASLSLYNKNLQNFIYLNSVTDALGNQARDQQGNSMVQYQQAVAQLYGLEATFALRPSTLRGFSFNNQLALCYGFNRNKNFEGQKQLGEYLPFIPPARLISNINQEFELHSKWMSSVNFTAEMDFNATQNRYLALYDTETKTNGYTLLNVGVGASLFSNCQLQFQVNNLLDEVYQSNMSRLKYFEYYSQSPNGRSGIYGMGRNFCIKLIVNF
ncbi:MAG TPA: TonB-dependent receptor [Cyclobacteriaceae bacterium]|nr:TonB-dependent receptor [Cyclobacteriaceae bacterium]